MWYMGQLFWVMGVLHLWYWTVVCILNKQENSHIQCRVDTLAVEVKGFLGNRMQHDIPVEGTKQQRGMPGHKRCVSLGKIIYKERIILKVSSWCLPICPLASFLAKHLFWWLGHLSDWSALRSLSIQVHSCSSWRSQVFLWGTMATIYP